MEGDYLRNDDVPNVPMTNIGLGLPDEDVPEESSKNQTKANSLGLAYGLNDVPPWYLSIVLGFQHYLTMFGATIAVPLFLANALCIGEDKVALSEIIGTIFFVSGIVTLLQTTFGVRLPIVQGGTFSFLAPAFAILGLPKWKCPSLEEQLIDNSTMTTFIDQKEIWQPRMRELQGAIMVASCFQVIIGFSGIIGLMLRYIGPLTIAPTITLVGLSLFAPASEFAGKHWAISCLTMVLIILFSQFLRNINIPGCGHSKERGCHCSLHYPLFKLFPIVLGIFISWFICFILTITNALPTEPNYGYEARTDTRLYVISESKWFRFPYPGQWGVPTVSVAGVFGMLAGVLASMMESIGDYYACARLAGAPPPPTHAINRGIGIEGIGCILAGAWGSGNGTTSYSENIGAIGITKVGSRFVIQCGGFVMIIFGMFGKLGAVFVSIPDPIVGGVFCIMFAMVTAVGLSNLQFVDLNSTRNLFVMGFSVFMGLVIPTWFSTNGDIIKTGSPEFDQIVTVLLKTSMFVGGLVGFLLDNTIPGTKKERGLEHWKHLDDSNRIQIDYDIFKVYDLPFSLMNFVHKFESVTKYIPFCPTYKMGFLKSKQETASEMNKSEKVVSGSNDASVTLTTSV